MSDRGELPASVAADELHAALAGGCSIVTSTRRLARTLQLRYAAEAPAPSWDTPDALPWSAWAPALYRELRDFGRIRELRACLDEGQAATLWEQLIAEDGLAQALLMPGAAAEGFRDAWRLVHEWRLPWGELEARAAEDDRVFLRLAGRYRDRLDALKCLDPAQLPALAAGALAGGGGRAVLLAGFDVLNPAQRALAAALGPQARRVAAPRHSAAPTLTGFPDEREELSAAAAWARRLLEENPAARIGIVVPELEAQGNMLAEALDEALAPRRLLPGNSDLPRPWNMSLAPPLADAPAVAFALASLAAWDGALGFAQASRWLRSPFLAGAAEEAGARARLEAWLREHATARIAPHEFLGWLAGREGAPACARLATAAAACFEALMAGPRRKPPSAWSQCWTAALGKLGWPGGGAVDSATWQAMEAWAGLLGDFARLDAVTGNMPSHEALARLRRLAGARRFQPEQPDVPVQVLGLLETAGLEFDALWVSGMHDGVLPAPLRPCPLLPVAVQRERGLPRACPEVELDAARRLVGRLASAAPQVRFSYPRFLEDEPLRPSPVVSHFPATPPAMGTPGPGLRRMMFEARRLESRHDTRGPPIAGEVSGGTSLLASQSACPFKAFAVHRLQARELASPAAGVRPSQRGLLVHQALRALWGTLRDRDGLAALGPGELVPHIREALAGAAVGLLPRGMEALLPIEIDEAAQRIAELLETERTRPDFAVVERELRITLELGPLLLTGQVDRIDRVPAGLLVIDYKTGEAKRSRWDGARPAEPQLPAYAIACGAEVAGLVYASLKPGNVGFQGLARSESVLGPALGQKSILEETQWAEQLADWRSVLESLARAFAAGEAEVDPLPRTGSASPCVRCHLATLCRRDEIFRAEPAQDD